MVYSEPLGESGYLERGLLDHYRVIWLDGSFNDQAFGDWMRRIKETCARESENPVVAQALAELREHWSDILLDEYVDEDFAEGKLAEACSYIYDRMRNALENYERACACADGRLT